MQAKILHAKLQAETLQYNNGTNYNSHEHTQTSPILSFSHVTTTPVITTDYLCNYSLCRGYRTQ
jgi:hypothetical protein